VRWYIFILCHSRGLQGTYEDRQQNDCEQVPDFCAGDKEHGKQDGHHQQDGAQIRFEQNQDHWQEGQGKRPDQGGEAAVVASIAEVPGQGKDVDDLAELRGLYLWHLGMQDNPSVDAFSAGGCKGQGQEVSAYEQKGQKQQYAGVQPVAYRSESAVVD
jgi:hypothetical protein